jgi:hypothetical protein
VDSPSTRQRSEERVPQRMFVRLYLSGGDDFQMGQTIDISPHGARIFTRKSMSPNQHLVLRSLRGNLTSYARVAYCEVVSENSYSLGLQLLNPIGDWASAALPSANRKI